MSDVYALLDYLSGRALPHIAPPPSNGRISRNREMRPRAQDAPDTDSIEDDLSDRNALLCRAMQIGGRIDSIPISPADLAFLILARDFLNRQAAPATGSTISFTIRVVHELLGQGPKRKQSHVKSDYLVADPSLDLAAVALARFVRRQVRALTCLLLLTVAISTYVACGKLLLDTRDAVNRDFGANMEKIMSDAEHDPRRPTMITAVSGSPDVLDVLCEVNSSALSLSVNCSQRNELKMRKSNIHDLLGAWMLLPSLKELPGEGVEQWATTMVGIAGNYVLPVLYGWLGALGFVLRRLNRQLADYMLTPRELRANYIRIVLGLVTGACIGLFVNNSTGAATLSGLGGAAVTLSASGIAFLAGYGVEAVFKVMDGFIDHVFRTNEDTRSRAAG